MGSLRNIRTERSLSERDETRIAEYACKVCSDSIVCIHVSKNRFCKRQKDLIDYQMSIPGYKYGIIKRN
jgi:hypothetical protein